MARRLLLLLLLLLLPALLRPGVAEPEAQPSSPPDSAEGRAFTCLAAAPSLAWYLGGEEGDGSSGPAAMEESGGPRVVTRRLNCSALDPATGHQSSAAVALHVQFTPELVQVHARDEEGREPGLLLVLFVLVQASPPAHITWVHPDGRLGVNTSHFLLVDAQAYPGRSRHTLEVQLLGRARNVSKDASALPPGFLDARIELPLLALVVGAAAALGALVGMGTLISYVVYQKGKKAAGLSQPSQLPARDANNLRLPGSQLPRANLSLPSNLQLNDISLEPKANGVENEDGPLSEPESSLAVENRGLGRFPMVGYIYRASSVSSEEIWL